MPGSSETFTEYVKMSIDSGVEPLELTFYPVVTCDSGFPVAYRTQLSIRSIVMGNLTENDFSRVCDERECGVRIFRHNIQHAISAIRGFARADRNINFVSIRCPEAYIERTDLYDIVSDVISKNPSLDPSKLCFEFPASVMSRDTEKARTALLDLKLLKVRSMITGCGAPEFPISKLTEIPPDIALLDPSASAWAGSRDKPQLFVSLLAYIKSMNIDIVACGNESNRKNMRTAECIGFSRVGEKGLTYEEALAQKEEDDASGS